MNTRATFIEPVPANVLALRGMVPADVEIRGLQRLWQRVRLLCFRRTDGPGSGMSIRSRLLLAVAASCAAVMLLTAAAVAVLYRSIEDAAKLEAKNLAKSVALEAATNRRSLQSLVQGIDALYRRDLFILDRRHQTLADIIPEELGSSYAHDHGEIEATMVDGEPREFVELSSQHPDGAALMAVPMRRTVDPESPIAGVVVLEFTSIERQLFKADVWGLYVVGLLGLATVIAVGAFGYRAANRLSRGIQGVRSGVLAFASGDTSVRIEASAADEVGDLSRAFNRMADELDQRRRELMLEAKMARQAAHQAEILAHTDVLTGLANRTQLAKLMAQTLTEAKRDKHSAGVLFMDLDRFKNINDTLGHEAGDMVLRAVAERLRMCLGPNEYVARLGGDEFVVVVGTVETPKALACVARRILTAVAHPVYIGSQELRVTSSIGISVFPRDGSEQQTLKKNADIALYRAKEEGRNGYAFYSPDLNPHSIERLAFESELRRAIGQGQLSVHYQPKAEPGSGHVSGVEALVRWIHPTMGNVPPSRFIPIAEETGLIVELGRWVLEQACRQQVAWKTSGIADVVMAVNLSMRQFNDPGLLDDVRRIIDETGIAPDQLELEITESLLMHNVASGMPLLHELKRIGLRLAVDDFGTGYSSLANLKRFPIDTLKIDRAFVNDLEGNDEDQAIVQAILSMARSLGLRTVAEGVETSAQWDFLRDRACDEIQGFLFSRPMPADALVPLLRAAQAAALVE
ncbi:EAL domain-containing protein [Paucibacter sp. R3-3]|uniref:EAL domain-containing protein n=1 Tax=Roseateles agri TaxID=3098619 RepID=A0ABU5DLH6_9BURK|nr:EAL domain-containing protein [Paucibacter sp. R3-3]MDY0745947.1 EAL domain-containing protein [Paucibacter sp. R3-3]